MSFDSPQKAEDFISSLSQQKTYEVALREGGGRAAGERRPLSLRPGGRGLMAGMEAVLAAQEGMMTGWTWKPEPVFCFSSLLSPTGILSLSIRYNNLFAGKTNTPFFYFGWD